MSATIVQVDATLDKLGLLEILKETGLYELLPAVYRLRDADQGGPLKSLIAVIAEQLAVLREDLAQRYDDHFIETCADWVVPYIGALVGHRTIYSLTPEMTTMRAAVANTIADRRRKGTAAMLQQLATDVTDWNANVVEYFQGLATTQSLNHLRPQNLASPDLRDWQPLEFVDTPFDTISRTADVRRIAVNRGRYNIPNVGIFLWRIRPYSLTDSPAAILDANRWFFSPLGANTRLFSAPPTVPDFSGVAGPENVSLPISRRLLRERLASFYPGSFSLKVDGSAVAAADVVACDLSDKSGGWANRPATHFGVDPILGRISVPASRTPKSVTVSFNYGFSASIGGGEYDRWPSGSLPDPSTRQVSQAAGALQAGIDAVAGNGVVEIQDGGRYAESPKVSVGSAQSIEIRAKNHVRPTVVMSGDFVITVKTASSATAAMPVVTIDGLLLTGGGISIASGPPIHLRLRHCTFVPGSTLAPDGTPKTPASVAVSVLAAGSIVDIDSCILGGMRISGLASANLTNSIVDATTPQGLAYAAADDDSAGGALTARNCTIVGRVHATLLQLASNCVFVAEPPASDATAMAVLADRRQAGCVRFCAIPPNSSVPSRYRCRPGPADDPASMRPEFESLRYGDPGYAQLSTRCPREISEGADDGAEMGVFHDLFQPQRVTNLTVRLDEYLRFGLEAGIYLAT